MNMKYVLGAGGSANRKRRRKNPVYGMLALCISFGVQRIGLWSIFLDVGIFSLREKQTFHLNNFFFFFEFYGDIRIQSWLVPSDAE